MDAADYTTPHTRRRDAALLRNTLLRLTAGHKVMCVALLALAAFGWYALAGRILAFGRQLDYQQWVPLGPQAISLLTEYSPMFWWGVVILGTCLVAYAVYQAILATARHTRGRLVDEDTIAHLARHLSAPGRGVLAWAWQNRRQPISIGVLQQASAEIRHGRAGKIDLAQRHAALLDGAGHTPPVPQEPTLVEPASLVRHPADVVAR